MELKKQSPDYFGVALLEEGIELRKKTKIKTPVLCLAPFLIEDIGLFIKYDIIPTISDKSHVDQLFKYNLKKRLNIHINIDTGMGLTGIPHTEAFRQIELLSLKKNIRIDGIFTIFSAADKKDKSFSKEQINKFKSVIEKLKKAGIEHGVIHAANSAALLNIPESYFDMVRTGSSLYGFYPSKETEKSCKIYPVMSLYSKISVVRELKKGESVGFGRTFTAKRDTSIATIPIGYADGFKRHFSNNFSVLIKGKYYQQIGNVSMDRIAFNVENDKILQGEKVVLLGKVRNEEITVWDWAERFNSIPYEITCTIGQRIPRLYKS